MRQGRCPLCDHHEIIEATVTEFSGEYSEQQRPLAVAHGTRHVLLAGERPDADKPVGLLNQCICRRCGFVQWFASEPGRIPIGMEYGTRLVQTPAAAPYRT